MAAPVAEQELQITMMTGPEAAAPTPLRQQAAGSASAPEASEPQPRLFQFHRRSSSAPAQVNMVKLNRQEVLTPQATARAIVEQFARRPQLMDAATDASSDLLDASDCDEEQALLGGVGNAAGIWRRCLEHCFGGRSL